MNIFGIYKGDGFVVFADQDMSNSAIDYFADKPEYETSKYLTVIQQKFNEAVKARLRCLGNAEMLERLKASEKAWDAYAE